MLAVGRSIQVVLIAPVRYDQYGLEEFAFAPDGAMASDARRGISCGYGAEKEWQINKARLRS